MNAVLGHRLARGAGLLLILLLLDAFGAVDLELGISGLDLLFAIVLAAATSGTVISGQSHVH